MQNKISKKLPELMLQTRGAITGVTTHGVGLGLVVKADVMTLHLDHLIDTNEAHVGAKVSLREKRAALDTMLKSAIGFATVARNVITAYTGTQPSPVLESAGFRNSLRIPRNAAGVLFVLQGVKNYFTDNSTHENPALNVHAARAATLITDLSNAVTAVNEEKGKVRAQLNARKASANVVRGDLQLVLKDLRVKVDPFSEVWEQFGFKRPGLVAIPAVPTNLTALMNGTTSVTLTWERAERAENYRVWKKVVGVDEEFMPVDLVSDLYFLMEGLPAIGQIQIAVSAVNNGGESGISELVTVSLV